MQQQQPALNAPFIILLTDQRAGQDVKYTFETDDAILESMSLYDLHEYIQNNVGFPIDEKQRLTFCGYPLKKSKKVKLKTALQLAKRNFGRAIKDLIEVDRLLPIGLINEALVSEGSLTSLALSEDDLAPASTDPGPDFRITLLITQRKELEEKIAQLHAFGHDETLPSNIKKETVLHLAEEAMKLTLAWDSLSSDVFKSEEERKIRQDNVKSLLHICDTMDSIACRM